MGPVVPYTIVPCSLGKLLVAGDGGLRLVLLGDEPTVLTEQLERLVTRVVVDHEGLKRQAEQLQAAVDDPRRAVDVGLAPPGTPFQQRVWQAIRRIPPSSTRTYAGLAQEIGQPSAVRAVARACAANPLAIAIPCHRVVRSDGTPGGYAWGVWRKVELLRRESGPDRDQSADSLS